MICRCAKERPFYEERPFKANLNGITKLKDRGYRYRYIAGSRYCALPNGIVTVRPPVCVDKGTKKKALSKVMPKIENEVGKMESSIKTPRLYSLNKRKVRGRVLVYADTIRRAKQWKKKELFFWTITFKAGMTDEICYQLLNIWLTTLRQKNRLHSYLWVAERQKNGTIHFHMLIPHYLDAKFANRTMMVSICSQIRKGKITGWNIHEAKRYNGVDIAKQREKGSNKGPVINFAEKKKARALQRYLTKYITKNNTKMSRLCWNSSVDWSCPFSGMTFNRAELVSFVPDSTYIKPCTYETEYCQFWPWAESPPKIFANHLSFLNANILRHWFKSIGKESIFFTFK